MSQINKTLQGFKGIGKIIGGSIESFAGVIIAKAGLGTFIFSNKFNLKDGKAAGVLMMVDGAALTFIGMSDTAEGTGDIISAVTGNPNKKSENFIKDKMFGGDESAYFTAKILLVALGHSGITTTKMWMGSSLAGGNQTTVKPGTEGTSGAGTSLKNASSSVGSKLNGTVSELKNGYKIEIPNGNKTIVVRIMNEGSGGRSVPYFRVSIDGKGSLTLDGLLSSDRALTHIDLSDNYLTQITNMITKFKGGK